MRLTLIALVLLAALACGAPGTIDDINIDGTTIILPVTATVMPTKAAGPVTPVSTQPANVKGGIVQDFLEPSKARAIKENVISAKVPTGVNDARQEVLYMRKAAEWTGTGNAIIDASGVPAGDVTIMWDGPQTLLIDLGGRTLYPDTTGTLRYMNQLYRKDQPLRFSVLAPDMKSWTITVAMPVLAE